MFICVHRCASVVDFLFLYRRAKNVEAKLRWGFAVTQPNLWASSQRFFMHGGETCFIKTTF
ncbi:hypothetical protein CEN40_03760 [Fischerella thermalis CCMEE 5205]|nr:hypothetical protein CEN40_03760 [Fischerella thermalis CCMEE 5205]